jgi:ATP synthase protein I
MPANQATNAVLRGAVVVTSAVAVVAIVAFAILGGGLAALGAALGAVITLVFFASGQWAVTRVLSRNPQFALTGALLVYVLQILALFVLIAVLKDATWLDPKAFAGTIVLCTLTWVLMLVWGTQRFQVLYVEPQTTSGTESAADAASTEVEQ